MSMEREMTKAKDIFAAAIETTDGVRSNEFLAGMFAALSNAATADIPLCKQMSCPFNVGSIQYDAWQYGHERGQQLWRINNL